MPEIEIKLRVTDADGIRRLLTAMAGRPSRTYEENEIYDTPDERLRSSGSALRLRIQRDEELPLTIENVAYVLTFKGPATHSTVRSREEYETRVEVGGALRAILFGLGFSPRVIYAKRRETWRLGECEVVLDELPRFGWFVEIEGPDEATIQRVRGEIGLTDAEPVRESYVSMAARHEQSNAGGAMLLFDAERELN